LADFGLTRAFAWRAGIPSYIYFNFFTNYFSVTPVRQICGHLDAYSTRLFQIFILFQVFHILGTPQVEEWPELPDLPDWKPNFPQFAGMIHHIL